MARPTHRPRPYVAREPEPEPEPEPSSMRWLASRYSGASLAAASHSGKRAHASGENVLRRAVGSTRISGPVFGTGGLASSPPGRVGLGSGLA